MTKKLFPLPLFLLPGGRARLRIFEPRYLRLVRECSTEGEGFVLAMMQGQSLCEYGTLVEIIDFESLPDGLLGITIAARQRVKLNSFHQEYDKLWVGDITPLEDWPRQKPEKATSHTQKRISDGLSDLFMSYPEHAQQYDAPRFDDITWTCQRWLEVLPLSTAQKQWFIAQDNVEEAKQFIGHLLEEESNIE